MNRPTAAVVMLAALSRFAAAQEATTAGPPPAPGPNPAPAPAADKQQVAPEPEAGPIGHKFELSAFGYLRMQYIAVQNDPNVQFVGRDDGFELQNARAGIRAVLDDKADVILAIDGAVDERAQNQVQGKLRVGLRDAFTDVHVGRPLDVRAGYFLAWVDPEALIPDTQREFVDHPIESRGMRSTEGWYTPGLPPGRSMGVALHMDPKPVASGAAIGFELAVQNGADEFAANNDNDMPAVSAAGVVRLPSNGFVIAAARWNPRTVGDLPFRQDETDYQGTLGAHVAFGPVAVGGGVIVQRTIFESTGGPAQDAYGAHAQLMVTIPSAQPLAVGYRFGVLDPSSLITTDRVMEHTLGIVLGVPSYRMRVQLQLTHVAEQADRDLSNDRIQLAGEVSL
ncbi:MAG: porin [Deltaproteobacteria bacterium]|nr:porin [Deltaproteobacteria bacterium]